MGHKTLRWLLIGGGIAIFIFVAFLRKEEPQPVSETSLTQTPSTITPAPLLDTPVGQSITRPPSEPTFFIHTVQLGETLFNISQQHNVGLQDIAQLNQIHDPSQIVAGQTIKIPTGVNIEAAGVEDLGETAVIPINPSTPALASNMDDSQYLSNNINNIPTTAILNLPPDTRQHINAIYTHGQELGRNPNAFSKLGDSTIMAPGLLVQFDQGAYNLGDFAYLQSVIDQYAGSFERYGAATHVGLHSWTVFDPMIADNTWCQGNENVLACELRLHNPSILFIRLGSNDAGIPESFDQHTREVVQFAIDNGVIPVIGTKADRFEGENNINNEILRQIAADYNVPLWDFDILAATLPNHGLDPEDNVHIDKATVANDYTQPMAFQSGQAMQDLSALLMLEAIWQEINN